MKTLKLIWVYFKIALLFILKLLGIIFRFTWKYFVIILRFIWKYNETFLAFPIGLYMLYYGTYRLSKLGLTTYDLGIIQKLIIGIAFFFIIIGMARLIHRMQWPMLSRLNDEDTNEKWKGVSKTVLCILSVVSFLVIVLSLSILIARI